MKKIPPIIKNFYLLTFIPYTLWMIFFADVTIVDTYRKYKDLREVTKDYEYYKKKNSEVEEEWEALKADPKLLEKHARENYYMHLPNEDVYVIEKRKK